LCDDVKKVAVGFYFLAPDPKLTRESKSGLRSS